MEGRAPDTDDERLAPSDFPHGHRPTPVSLFTSFRGHNSSVTRHTQPAFRLGKGIAWDRKSDVVQHVSLCLLKAQTCRASLERE